ncbi:MAG: MBL fold metallo-hydrolase [Syntrophaceae bacterium]|nr:MBL fold metallo-hydrolase [Syntrophaceae bacterium]
MKKKILMVVGILAAIVILVAGYVLGRFLIEVRKMTPVPTGEVVPGVFAIQDDYVNLYLIKGKDGYVMIDGGDKAAAVEEGLRQLGIPKDRISAVFLTHSDSDHSAALKVLGDVPLFVGSEEERIIKGPQYRMYFMRNSLPDRRRLLAGGETVDSGGLIVQVFRTPGHTPGSRCYLVNGRWLFTGDTISLKDGKAGPFVELFNMDTATEIGSIGKIAALKGVEAVFTGHHGFTKDFPGAFADWQK